MSVINYSCTNCYKEHKTGELCPNPRLNDVEKYRSELIKKSNAFRKGYGKVTSVILGAYHDKLFGETYEK